MVPFVAVAGRDPLYLPVGVVHEHVLALTEPRVVALPPGEHRLSLVGLHPEVEGVLLVIALKGMEPHRITALANDQRSILAQAARPWLLLRGDEDVTGGRVARLRAHLDGGRAELRSRTEGPRLLPASR